MIIGLITVALIIVIYGALSGLLDKRGVTSAMVFVMAGLVVGTAGLNLVNIQVETSGAEQLCNLALVFLLFSDSTRIDLVGLRHNLGWPVRLLLIGLPLTIVTGVLAGSLVFSGLALTSVFLLSTMLCSTDAALGQRVVMDEAVPERVRQALDVESGLNDGLAVPFFLVAVDLALAQLATGLTSAVVQRMAEQIGWGVFAGLSSGAITGLLLRWSDERGWLEGEWRQIMPFVGALMAYLVAIQFGGSGFIAAFSGGLTFGYFARRHGLRVTSLNEDIGGVLAAFTWIGFGALAVGLVLPTITLQTIIYAVLSLTLIRMVPVAIALFDTGAQWPTVAFIGWFGPRGLASVVFGLIALDSGIPDVQPILTTVVLTILMSVFLHGLSSVPLVAAYSRWYGAHVADHPSAPEARPTIMTRLRRQGISRSSTRVRSSPPTRGA